MLARLAPGDFVTESLGIGGAAAQTIEQARARYGLEQVDRRAVSRLARRARPARFRPLAALRPAGARSDSRARAPTPPSWRSPRSSLATLIGLPLGVVTGSRRGGASAGAIRAASLVLLSMPPLLTSLFLVFVAARTGWLPIAGMRSATCRPAARCSICCVTSSCRRRRSALPLAAMLERLQAQAMSEVIGEPFVLAALARGVAAVARRLARRAEGGAPAGARPSTVWSIGTLLERIVRGRSDHRVAGPRQPDAAGAARARRLSGRRLRRRRRAVPRLRHAAVGRGARASWIRARASASGARMTRASALALVAIAVLAAVPRAVRSRRTRRDAALRRPAQRAADACRTSSTPTARGTRRSSIRGGWSSQLEQRYEAGSIDARAAGVVLGRPSGRVVGRRARAAAAARRRQLRPRRLQPAAVRRPHLARRSRSLAALGAMLIGAADRRRRRLRAAARSTTC